MATKEQLGRALVNAHKAGDVAAAKKLANAIKNQSYASPAQQDVKAAGNGGALDFTKSNEKISELEQVRQSGALDSPISKLLDLSPAGGVMDAAASMASSAIAEPVAGIAGLAGLPFGAERAAKNVEDTRNLIARQPRTPIGKAIVGGIGSAAQSVGDALGSPLEKARSLLGDAAYDIGGQEYGPALGAAATAIPDAAMMGLGAATGKFLPKAGAKVADKFAARNAAAGDALLAEAKAIQDQFKQGAFEMNPTDPALKQVADILMRDDPAEIAGMLKTDPKFFDAVKALGINKTAPAAYSSDNPAYRGIEQGLAAQAANPLGILGDDFIKATQQKAGELITKYKGSSDKAGIDKKFKEDLVGAIDNLARVEEIGYDKMRANLPGGTKASTSNISAHIKSLLKTRNNDVQTLPPFLREIYFSLKPKVKTERQVITDPDGFARTLPAKKTSIQPTFDILEDQRKLVGRAYNKKQGVYAEEDTHMLGEAYAALRADADAVYEKAGMLDELKELNKTTVLRKELEENSIDLLGKELSKSITFKVGAAMKGATSSGGVETFTQLMGKIKNKDMRQKVAVTAINYLLRGTGANKGELSIPKIIERMDELNKQPTAKKAIAKELPKGMMEDLDNLHYISRRIYLANQSRIPTGVSSALFNQDAGLLARLGGTTANAILTGASLIPLVSPFATKAKNFTVMVKGLLKDGKVTRGEAVTRMLASPDFQAIVIDAAKPGAAKSAKATKKLELAEKRFKKSKTYQDWASTLDEAEVTKLEAAGLTGYLLGSPTIIPITKDQSEKKQ